MFKKISILSLALVGVVLMGAGCIQFTGTSQGPMGMFMSVDKAENWQQKNTLVTAQGVKSLSGAKVYKIFTDPTDPKALYMGTRGQGLFYSYDNGETWNESANFKQKYIYALSVDPKDTCTIFVSDGPNIYKTTDCQRTWKTVFTEPRPDQRLVSLASDFTDPRTMYAAEIGGDILRSKDGGTSWHIIKNFNFELRHFAVDPFNPRRLYAASYTNGLYRSDDGGETWEASSNGFDNFSGSMNFYRLIFSPVQKDSLFWISKYGILRSNDGGATWSDIKLLTPPGGVNIYAFAINPQNTSEMYFTGTILGDRNQNIRSTLYKTSDGGVNWVTKKLPTNTIPVDLLVSKDGGKNIFLGFTTL
jgi:photosystem II stability/assembly factor-like uncharacterized protein